MPLKMLPISRANPAGVFENRKTSVKANRRSRQLRPMLLREKILKSGSGEAFADAAVVVADVAMDEVMGETGQPSRARQRPL